VHTGSRAAGHVKVELAPCGVTWLVAAAFPFAGIAALAPPAKIWTAWPIGEFGWPGEAAPLAARLGARAKCRPTVSRPRFGERQPLAATSAGHSTSHRPDVRANTAEYRTGCAGAPQLASGRSSRLRRAPAARVSWPRLLPNADVQGRRRGASRGDRGQGGGAAHVSRALYTMPAWCEAPGELPISASARRRWRAALCSRGSTHTDRAAFSEAVFVPWIVFG
jgi:hypothetical protein